MRAGGDLLLADVGAETPSGWAGDVTRTWPVSGRYSATQRDMYEGVLAAQRTTIEAVRPGGRSCRRHPWPPAWWRWESCRATPTSWSPTASSPCCFHTASATCWASTY